MKSANEIDGENLSEPEKKRKGQPKGGWPSVKARKAKREALKEKGIFGSEDDEKTGTYYLGADENIPQGPYKTQAERWDAYRKVLDLNAVREKRGKKRLAEKLIERYVGVPYQEFDREIFTTGFQNFRLAKASMHITGTLADIAPALRLALLELAQDMETDKGKDPKKQREMISLVSTVMEKFGIQKIDTSYADSSQDMDTEEAIEEGMRIVQEMKGHEEYEQWFTTVATNTRKSQGKPLSIKSDRGTSENDKDGGPGKDLEAVPIRQETSNEQVEVPNDDRVQSTEQNGLVDNGLQSSGNGETPNI